MMYGMSKIKSLIFIFYNYLCKLLMRAGIYVKHFNKVDVDGVRYALNLLRVSPSAHQFKRYGGIEDGGYVLPTLIENCKYCISPGVGPSSTFEQDLERYNIPSLLLDKSVSGPAHPLRLSKFLPYFLGPADSENTLTLDSCVKVARSHFQLTDAGGGILQMDIEGAELGCILSTSTEVLSYFDVISLELHNLDKVIFSDFRNCLIAAFDKLKLEHDIIHAHANNCCGSINIAGIDVPRVLELTLSRKSLEPATSEKVVGAGRTYDNPSLPFVPELGLDDWWFKS